MGKKIGLHELAQQYAPVLREYCAQGGEAALFRAYELGRQAANEGRGALEMAAVHQEALEAILFGVRAVQECTRIARRAAELFAECLAPFELRRRVYQAEHARLCTRPPAPPREDWNARDLAAAECGLSEPAADEPGDDLFSEERVHRTSF